jgi:TrpR family transcriptional regulator, trp operon repressor
MAAKTDDKMIDAFCSITDREDMRRLFAEIFTSAELDDLTLRWKLLAELTEGRTQRDISKRLGISLCKITRGARLLKDEKSVLRSIFKKDIENQ